jgi:hypothetical protein
MQLPVIKTYHSQIIIVEHHFFILSKGNNSGRPMDQPCPNCFVVICDSKQQRELFYWLTYALWQSKSFQMHIIGSVIPFIRIKDVRNCIINGYSNVSGRMVSFNQSVVAMRKHHDNSKKLKEIMHNKQILLQNMLRLHLRSS